MFLNNPSRLTFQLVPDNDFDEKQDNKIKEFLISKQKSLSDTEIKKINKLNAELEIRQNKKDNPDILPKVTVSDIEIQKNILNLKLKIKMVFLSFFIKLVQME